MKISKKAEQTAKQIFLVSKEKGKTSETRLKKFLSILSKEKSAKAREILSYLEKLLLIEKKNNQLVLESAFPLTKEERKNIQTYFESKFTKNLDVVEVENKDLISGIKIKLSDNIWENTVQSNLEKLKGSVNL